MRKLGMIMLLGIWVQLACNATAGATAPAPTSKVQGSIPAAAVPAASATLQATASATPQPTSSSTPLGPIGENNLDRVVWLHHDYYPAILKELGGDYNLFDIVKYAFSPDGRYLAVGGSLQTSQSSSALYNRIKPFALILDTHTESILANLPQSALVTSLTPELMDVQTVDLAFTHDSSRLIYVTTGAGPHNVRYGIFGDWNVAEGRLDHVIWKGNGSLPAVAISPDDHRLALLGAEYNTMKIWDLAAGKFVASAPSLSDYSPKRAYFSTDGTRLAVDIGGREIVIYDTATWRETVHFNLPLTNAVGPVYAISPDLSLLATTLNGGDITQNLDIWDPATGKKINTLTEGSGNTIPGGEFLNFTPDGRTLLRITNDGLVYAWNTADWRSIGSFNTFALYTYTFGGGLDPQRCCLFSSDGRTILVPSITEIDLFGLP